MSQRMKVIGHRGAPGLGELENTLASFQRAMDVGADMVELDVRRTRDGVLVCHHDATIDGVALGGLDWSEVQRRAPQVPRLVEVAQWAQGAAMLDVELKESGYEAQVLDALRVLSPDEFVVKSFIDSAVGALRMLDPGVSAGLLLGRDRPPRWVRTRWSEFFPGERMRRCDATFVAPHAKFVRLGFVARMHARGWPVYVWTVNDPTTMRRLMRAGVDAIVSDRPDLAYRERERMSR